MKRLIVTARDGRLRELEAKAGLSIMQLIRDAGVEDSFALCDGCCSCATCHIYVHEDDLVDLPPLRPGEDELLESSLHRRETSRLACQIRFSAAQPLLRVTIAPEDWSA